MSALSEAKEQGLPVDLSILGPWFWKWYHRHELDVIVKRKIIVFNVTVRVRDANILFVMLFGPDPMGYPSEVL